MPSASGVPDATVLSTYALVAADPPAVGVGTVTVPVNVGFANGDFKFNSVCTADETGLLASEVLSTLPSPTSDFVIVTLVLRACPLTVVVVLTLLLSPGTVGASAVPPKSPVSFTFPFVTPSASGVPAETVLSTYALVAAAPPVVGVGTVTVPVRVGLFAGALEPRTPVSFKLPSELCATSRKSLRISPHVLSSAPG